MKSYKNRLREVTRGYERLREVILATYILTCFFLFFIYVREGYAQEQDVAESFGLYSKGIMYYRTGDLDEAKELLEKSVALDPRNEDAKVYLGIVNAEIRLSKRNLTEDEEYLEGDEEYIDDEYSYEPEYYEEEQYEDMDIEPEPLPYERDKIKAIANDFNEVLFPGEIKGEYRVSLGVTGEDIIWKDANGDYNERNFRMIDHNFPKMNTYDKAVYDKVKVVFDTNTKEQGFNFHSDITVDPWSFVGKTDKFTVESSVLNPDGTSIDKIELELKYWAGTGRTINENYYTLDYSYLLSMPEYKVIDGKIPGFTIDSKLNDDPATNPFSVPEQDINFTFQPVREMWFDYNTDDYKLKIFPFALEDKALSSNDPLGLSNHHIYWEPSPWLDDWVPGLINDGYITPTFWQGKWSDDLSFFTRDSDLQRLTALRGVSFEGDFNNSNLSFTIASPKGLWQDYDSVTSLPGAIRAETYLTDDLMIGAIDTFRFGYNEGKTDSYNNVFGIDASYDILPDLNIVGEVAISKSEDDITSSFATEKNGSAGHIAVEKEMDSGSMRIALTHMDKGFDPGLASYRETRRDQYWSRHINFKKPLEFFQVTGKTLKYEDIEPFRIGDGVDVGRDAFNFRLITDEMFEGRMDNLIDYRYVQDSNHKYVEGVFRDENTFRIMPKWAAKSLFIYHSLPKTKAGIDPIMSDADTGEYLVNTAIEEGNDPSISTYSTGLEYAPDEWISIFGIYENTNDFTFATGDYPRGLLLQGSNFVTETIEGKSYRMVNPLLYSQGFFDLPPYERFNIYRAGISLKPCDKLGIDFDYTKNDFKFAGGIDDNMNHFGTTVEYKFNNKLTGFLKYTVARMYNLYRLNTSDDLKYEEHHNVFLKLDYNVTEYGLLAIEFGVGALVAPSALNTANPVGDYYPTLDTQHILTVYYKGVF